MNVPTGVAMGVAGLVIGFLLEARMESGRHADTARALHSAADRAATGRASGKKPDDDPRHKLAGLEKHLRERGIGPDLAGHMERLGTDEIRSLMEELWMSSKGENEDLSIYHEAIRAAAHELYRREGMAALEWANNVPPEQGKVLFLKTLTREVVKDSPAAAKPWVDLYLEKYTMIGENPFREVAFRAASAKGVDAVLEARKVLGDGKGDQFVHGPLPEDFDFNRLLVEAQGAMGSYSAVGFESSVELWAGRDPDAAWQALMEIGGEDRQVASRYLSSIFDGMSQTEGEDAAVKWMAARLDDLPANLRTQALFATMNSHDLRYEVVDKVLDGLPTDQDRVSLAMGTVTPFNGDGPLDILRHLGSSSLQTDALVGAAKSFSRMASDPQQKDAKEINDYFSKIITDLNLPPEDRERVMETLSTPQDLFGK